MNAIVSLCHFCEVHGPKVVYSTQPFRPQEPKDTNVDNSKNDKNITYRRSNSTISNSSDQMYPSSSRDTCEGCSSAHIDFVSHDAEAKVSYVSTHHISNGEVYTRIRRACLRSLSCEVCQGREGPIFFGDDQCGQVLSYTFYICDTQARGMQSWYSILVIMMDKIYLLNSWPFLVQNIRLIIDNLQTKAKKVYDMEEAKCSQRSSRLRGVVDPTNFINKRGGGNKSVRSLQDMTGDKNVFCMLHSSFIWLLHVCGNKTKETLLEGPPTEDSIIDVEKQEVTEEGFVMIHTRKVVDGDLRTGDPSSVSEDDGETVPLNDIERQTLDDTEGPCVKNLRHLRKCLGNTQFQALAHHVVIGNQVIIRSCENSLATSVIRLLKNFLPKGSSRIPFLFLSIPPDSNVPEAKIKDEHIVLYITVKGLMSLATLGSDHTLDKDDFNEDDDEDDESRIWQAYRFEVTSPITLPTRVPTVLHRMLLVLGNGNLSQEVVEWSFTCLKEEWMNKVKVHYTFIQSSNKRSDDETKKLLQMQGVREEDRAVLEFWMTGLSVQYRTHVMSRTAHR